MALASRPSDGEYAKLGDGEERPAASSAFKHNAFLTRLANDGDFASLFVFFAALVLGLVLGFVTPTDKHLPEPWARVSSVVGWTYFGCWFVGWYPQLILNWQRRSVSGMSFDYSLYNFLGFLCYSAFNCALFFNPHIQQEYRHAHKGNDSGVRVNDVAFSLHANAVTALTMAQILAYDRGGQGFSRTCLAVCAVATLGAVLSIGGAALGVLGLSAWSVLYYISLFKLLTTLVKYLPQRTCKPLAAVHATVTAFTWSDVLTVSLNYKRKSTAGWNVANASTDFAGGVLSLGQQVLDAAVLRDWTILTGDPTKLGLALLSLLYTIVLLVQHYIVYPDHTLPEERWAQEEGGDPLRDPLQGRLPDGTPRSGPQATSEHTVV